MNDAPPPPAGSLTPDATLELYGGEVKLHYEDGHHVYWVEEEGKDPHYIVSTTAVTKVIDKSDALIGWALAQMARHVRRAFTPGHGYRRTEFEEILKEGQKAHTLVSGEAMSVGTEAHMFAETYALAEMGECEYPTFPARGQALKACEAWMDWVEDTQPEWIAAEQKVYSRAYGYSGTFDLLARIDGELTVVDWKTSKRLYPEYLLQVAGYAAALHEMWGHGGAEYEPVSAGLVVHVPKTGKRVRHRVHGDLRRYDEMRTRDLKALFTVFRACLHVRGWKEELGIFAPHEVAAREERYEGLLVAA
jgi:hypothetical protein